MITPRFLASASTSPATGLAVVRPPEVVFDFVADERNEPRFNPQMATSSLDSGEPIGEGSRFTLCGGFDAGNAVAAAARIRNARFVGVDSGGHLLLGREAAVREETSPSMAAHLQGALPTDLS